MGVPRAAQALAPRAGQPQGVGAEAYLNGTSQEPTPEDAWKDGHIHGRSKLFMNYPGSPCSWIVSVAGGLRHVALRPRFGLRSTKAVVYEHPAGFVSRRSARHH